MSANQPDKNPTTVTDADRWHVICFMARHVFFCWPRRWSYDYRGRAAGDLCSYRRTCLRCGLIHEHKV